MRKNILFIGAAIACAVLFAVVSIPLATDAPDEINILDSSIENPKKGAVHFTHKKHAVDYKIACTECHHVYKEGKNVFKQGDPVQKCSACHDPVKSEGNVKKLMLAFHKNCQGCHKDLEAAGKPTGPTKKCNDCHATK
jgi:predicted CXXCH cytochrome family protein